MDYTKLALALIAAAPGLVTAFRNLLADNPQKQDESDEQFAARMNADTLQMAAATTANDNAVSGDGTPAP